MKIKFTLTDERASLPTHTAGNPFSPTYDLEALSEILRCAHQGRGRAEDHSRRVQP